MGIYRPDIPHFLLTNQNAMKIEWLKGQRPNGQTINLKISIKQELQM
jgi:hypothetical protein